MDQTLLIIDFLYVAYRAFHSAETTTGPVSARFPDGEPLSVTHNLINITHTLIAQTKATNVVFAFDAEGKNFRQEIYPDYKAGRPGRPPALDAQLSRARETIEMLGYEIFEVPTFEADDVIATLVRHAEIARNGLEPAFCYIYVATGDHDLLPLASKKTAVLDLSRNLHAPPRMTPAAVYERYKLDPNQLVDFKTLTGDSSDNISGIPGLTKKDATALLQKYQDVTGIYKHLAEIESDQLRELLETGRPAVSLARRLINMNNNVPLTLHSDSGLLGYLSRDSMVNYLSKLGLTDLVKTLPKARRK
jgi:DNA polymerase-1